MEGTKEIKIYKKECKYCNKPYESESRNQRYCSDECCDNAQIKRKKVNKTRARKRKERAEFAEENTYLSRAYKLTSATVELLRLPKCSCKHCRDKESVAYETHHLNMNVLDNRPENLVVLCKKLHALVHAQMPNINMVWALNQARLTDNPSVSFTEILNEFNVDVELAKKIIEENQ